MKNCVYILLCCNNRFYIGSTIDLKNRFKKHQTGQVKSTRDLRPLKLVFHQVYQSIHEARKIEQWLKRQKSRKLIEQIIKERIIKKN